MSECANATASPWTGLSDFWGDHIAQDGTNIRWPGSDDHQAWIETYSNPSEPSDINPTPLPFYASPGDNFEAKVKYNGDYTVTFYLYNGYKDKDYGPITKSWPNAHTGYADFIMERVGGSLTNFDSIQWSQALSDGSGQQSAGNLNNLDQETNGGDIMTQNTGIQNSNGGFTTSFVRC